MPIRVLALNVVTVTVITTLLVPQFLKQSGSLSGECATPASPSVGPVGGSGKLIVALALQAGVQPTLKLRAPAPGGFSREATESNGSDGIGARKEFVPNIAVHWEAVMKPGRFAHS